MQINTNSYTPDIISIPENKIIDAIANRAVDKINDNITNNIQDTFTNRSPEQEEYESVNYDDSYVQKESLENTSEVSNYNLSQDTNNYILNRAVIETNELEDISNAQNIQELLDISTEQKERIFNEIRNTIFSNTQNQKDEDEFLTQLQENQHVNNRVKSEIQAYVSASGLEAQTHMLLMLTQQTVANDVAKQNYNNNY